MLIPFRKVCFRGGKSVDVVNYRTCGTLLILRLYRSIFNFVETVYGNCVVRTFAFIFLAYRKHDSPKHNDLIAVTSRSTPIKLNLLNQTTALQMA